MLLFVVLLFGIANGLPVFDNPMFNPGMYDGDMMGVILDEDRNAVTRDSQIWPQGILPYVIDSSLANFKSGIQGAMKDIEDASCVRFVERTDEKDYVRLFSGQGCWANWGRIGGKQDLSLGSGCRRHGTYLHEILHAMGFEHEHNRSDRDQYIRILWENIEEEMQFAFSKLKPNENRLLTTFDYESIMMYGPDAFIKAYGLKSMESLDGRRIAGTHERHVMTASDIKRINMLYKCN